MSTPPKPPAAKPRATAPNQATVPAGATARRPTSATKGALSAAADAGAGSVGEHSPLNEQELDTLQSLMDSLPDTLDPLDTVMIDGYL